MDDILIYLIFVAFALLSRFLSKKKNPQQPSGGTRSDQSEGEAERPQKHVSFEDLLREFTGEAEKRPAPAPSGTYEDEYESDEEEYTRDEEAREVYNKSINQAKNLKTIDELVDYDTIKTKLDEPLEPEVQKNTLADEIRDHLKNPNEIKKAVIYSEILQRKY